MTDQHMQMITEAGAILIGIADDSGMSLVDVIAKTELYIVRQTKVSDAGDGREIPTGRRGYTLVDGRLVEVQRPMISSSR